MGKEVKLRDKDYAKILKYAKKNDIPVAAAVGIAIDRMDVKKLSSKEKKTKSIDFDVCDQCDCDVPSDASFCPYCGVQFKIEDDDSEDSGDSEDLY